MDWTVIFTVVSLVAVFLSLVSGCVAWWAWHKTGLLLDEWYRVESERGEE